MEFFENYRVKKYFCKNLTDKQILDLRINSNNWSRFERTGIVSRKPIIEVSDMNVDQACTWFRERRSTFWFADISQPRLNEFLSRLCGEKFKDRYDVIRDDFAKELVFIGADLTEESINLLRRLKFIEKLSLIACKLPFKYSGSLSFDIEDFVFSSCCTDTEANRFRHKFACDNKTSLKRIDYRSFHKCRTKFIEEKIFLPKLESIALTNEYMEFQQFFKKHPQLKRVSFKKMLLAKEIFEDLNKYCYKLNELCIENCVGRENVVNIECGENLKVLKFMATLKCNLTNSDFENLKDFRNDNLHSDVIISLIANMRNLSNLDLNVLSSEDNGFWISSQLVDCISQFCPQLEQLRFPKYSTITMSAEVPKFSTFNMLLKLGLSTIPVTDDFLSCFCIPKLKSINLKSTSVTDNGLKYLSENFPYLRKVILDRNSSITFDGISYLVNSKLLYMKNVSYKNCYRIPSSPMAFSDSEDDYYDSD